MEESEKAKPYTQTTTSHEPISTPTMSVSSPEQPVAKRSKNTKLDQSDESTTRCAATCHSEAAQMFPDLRLVYHLTSNRRLFVGPLKETFLRREFIVLRNDRPSTLCGACVEYVKSINEGRRPSDIKEQLESRKVDEVLCALLEGRLPDSDKLRLVQAVASLCKPLLLEFASKSRPTIEDLKKATYSATWKYKEANLLCKFLMEVTDFESVVDAGQHRATIHMQKALENLSLVVKPRFTSALAVSENIVLHSLTSSRLASDMYACSNACGGHTYMESIIRSISVQPPKFPVGDIFVAFDNQQVIGKEYRVSAGGGQKTSTVTTICVFKENTELNIQAQFPMSTFIPVPSADPQILWNLYSDKLKIWTDIHRSFRDRWIAARLEKIRSETLHDAGNLEDPEVDAKIKSNAYETGLHYSRVEAVTSSCTVTDIENLMINPNSHATVKLVLDKLLELNTSSDETRKWFSVYCDGLPHGIAWKLIQSTWTCDSCKLTGSETQIEAHDCGTKNAHRTYEKILLRPGAGHIEINIVRTIFAEFFSIYIRPVAILLGFKSQNSLDYCKSAADHHKSWQILKILYVALTDELVYLFSQTTPENLSVDGFGKWRASLKNPNIKMAFDFVFSILHPLFLYRAAIRQCNDNVATAALSKLATIFCGFNHPKYREIYARDLFLQLTLPSRGSPMARRNSFRMQGSSNGQGLDFLLEERNKQQKRWLFSCGTPTEAQWKRASGSLTCFETMKENVLTNMNLAVSSTPDHQKNYGKEYLAVRKHFRNAFSVIGNALQSLEPDGVSLNPEFINFCAICEENLKIYLSAYLAGKKCHLLLAKSTKLTNLSTEELAKEVKRNLRQLPSAFKTEIQDKLKRCDVTDDYIELLGEIADFVDGFNYKFEI